MRERNLRRKKKREVASKILFEKNSRNIVKNISYKYDSARS